MKKLFSVISGTLALNFLALVIAIGWGFKSGRLDHEKVRQIKQIVLAPATRPAEAAPAAEKSPTTLPSVRLEQLLATVSGRSASEQVEFIQRTFDAQAAQLDRRHRELSDLQRKVDMAQSRLLDDRKTLAESQKKLDAQQQEQSRALGDKGFQETLALYTTMQAKQVKSIFMTLDDRTVMAYLRAMEPRQASKIVKEFKAPEEMDRISKIMEKMRQAQALAKD